MRCAIWYPSCNSKYVKKTHGGVLLSSYSLRGCFSRFFLNCKNGTKMRNTSQKTKSAKSIRGSEAYSKPCQSSKNELFAKIINSFQPFTIFEKTSILDIQQGFEYI